MNRLGFKSRIALFGSAAALALTIGSAANAQVEEQQQTPPPLQADQAETRQGNPAIVVTAQKREERIQDVPISISVVDQEKILDSGSSQLVDYAAYVPGFQVDNAGSPGRSTRPGSTMPPRPIARTRSSRWWRSWSRAVTRSWPRCATT